MTELSGKRKLSDKRSSPAGEAKSKKKSKNDGWVGKKTKDSKSPNQVDGSSNQGNTTSAQKRILRKERQSHRKHAESVEKAKSLWNQLRMKSNSPQDTQALMEQVMTLIQGKVYEIALQHDASRVVQAAIQFGSDVQRKELLQEICHEGPSSSSSSSSSGGLAELAKIQYAHFCCLKFIKYCARDDACVKMIVKSFKGTMPKLAVHSVGARVVESLFLNLPAKSTLALKQEFYGPHFSLFAREVEMTPTLKRNLEMAKTDTQKEAAISFVKDNILSKGMTKGFYGYTFFQELMAEYIDVMDGNEVRNMASMMADHSIHLLSTRAGSRVVAECAAYGTPKDRKKICKSLKGYTMSSLLHRDAYIAILRLVQVTDDTVSINKSIINEIVTVPSEQEQQGSKEGTSTATTKGSPLLDLARSESGSKLFLMLTIVDEAARMKYFDPYERSILTKDATVQEKGQTVPTSKKDPEMRRQELFKYLQPAMETLCTQFAAELLTSLPGSRILKEFYKSTRSEGLIKAVLQVCGDGSKSESSADIFEDPVGHRTIKNLILCDVEHQDPTFSQQFLKTYSTKDQLFGIASKSNRGAFVVAALFQVPSLRKQVQQILKSTKSEWKALSEREKVNAGYLALLKELS